MAHRDAVGRGVHSIAYDCSRARPGSGSHGPEGHARAPAAARETAAKLISKRDSAGLSGISGIPGDERRPAWPAATRPKTASSPKPSRPVRPGSAWRDLDAGAARREPHHSPMSRERRGPPSFRHRDDHQVAEHRGVPGQSVTRFQRTHAPTSTRVRAP